MNSHAEDITLALGAGMASAKILGILGECKALADEGIVSQQDLDEIFNIFDRSKDKIRDNLSPAVINVIES